MSSRLKTTIALTAAICCILPSLSALAQSTAPAPGPTWGAGPGSLTPEPDGVTIEIHDNQALVVMGRPGCPFAVVGHEVWNLAKQQKTAVKIPHSGKRDSLAALSDDGTLLVVGKSRYRGDDHDSGADATVWNTQTGAKICEIPSSERELDMDYLGLAANQNVLICARPSGSRKPAMEVWDAKTGKLVRRFACNFYDAPGTTISPDGRYIAMADAEQLNVYDISTGESVVTMPPPADAPAGVNINAGAGSVRVRRSIVPYINMQALAFSPDGNELAGVSGAMSDRHFFSWDHQAKLEDNFTLPINEFDVHSGRPFLQWSPDNSAWLVNQHMLVDRKTHRLLWEFPLAFADYPQSTFLDNNRLFVIHHGPENGSQIVTIPWDALHQAAAAMTTDPTKALLASGGKVSVDVTLVKPRGDEAATKKELIAALTQALAAGGVAVTDDQPTVITLNLEEAPEGPLPIVTPSSPFDLHGEPTGRMACPAKGVLTLTIHARGSDTAVFTTTAHALSMTSSETAITDNTLRQSMLDSLARDVASLTLPYYISKDNPPVMLPMGLPPSKPAPSHFLDRSSTHGGVLQQFPSPDIHRRLPRHPPVPDPATTAPANPMQRI